MPRNLKRYEIPGKWFLFLYLPVLVAASVLLILFSKSELHLAVNRMHCPFSDLLMKYWTLLGDGIVLAVLTLTLGLVSMRSFFTSLAAYAFGGLSAQLLKRLVFPDVPRPLKYFEIHEPGQSLRIVEGVDLHSWFSFPSGHTSTAFAVFFALALLTRYRALQVLLFCLALGVAVSRIYLSQHFLADVTAGSLLGVAAGTAAWVWMRTYSVPWMEMPVQQIISRKQDQMP